MLTMKRVRPIDWRRRRRCCGWGGGL